MTQALEPTDESLLVLFRWVPKREVLGAQFLVGRVSLKDEIGGDQPLPPLIVTCRRRA